jgi:hypothetical protein
MQEPIAADTVAIQMVDVRGMGRSDGTNERPPLAAAETKQCADEAVR